MLQVKPTLQRLKGTLLGSGTALVLTAGVLFGLVTSGADADGMYGGSPLLLAVRLCDCVTEAGNDGVLLFEHNHLTSHTGLGFTSALACLPNYTDIWRVCTCRPCSLPQAIHAKWRDLQ